MPQKIRWFSGDLYVTARIKARQCLAADWRLNTSTKLTASRVGNRAQYNLDTLVMWC
jgi:hypothetical protein